MIFRDYYKILELNTSKVSKEQVKNAYRNLAKKYHPDINVGNKQTEERFKDINEAYRVLSNSSSKRKYDRMWHAKVGNHNYKIEEKEYKPNKDSVFSEFFHMFFGDNKETGNEKEYKKDKKQAKKGDNIETEITITIEEAFYGLQKKISLRTVEGKMKTFTVTVPAGIRNGEKIRLMGQGKQGEHGGKNGDLFIKINILDSLKFKLKGYDILVDLGISPWEAALGARVNVSGIDELISLYIPPGIQSGEIVKIPKKGYKDGQGSRGDLITKIKILVPKQLTAEEKELFQKMQEISTFRPRKQS